MQNDGVEFGDEIENVGNFAVAVEIQLRLDVIFYKQSNFNFFPFFWERKN